ncbi:nucleoside deaminase [Halolamina sp.]|jgi:tRNA(Arg) A34 adenosine deaminase TadA|uniref:nucleoside deaminase n=1 Tax=Halolamina sp. TaxID=1940283 RepID=UPI000223BF30|nr:CMP/dCMP deaminase zinc-binding protein [halophilic archaeon DL31]
MAFDDFDHEAHMRRAIELAREAADRGDGAYGSVLVKDDEIVMEERNAEVTDGDMRAHPELTLAKRAAAERDDAEALVMYTSTEPCPMCSGGIDLVGLDKVVYSVSGQRAGEIHGSGGLLPSTEVFAAGRSDVEVVPDVLHEAGEAVHRENR